MPGIISHITIALISAAIVYYSFKFKKKHAFAIAIGNVLPDLIKFGLTGIKQGTLAIVTIEQNSFYDTLTQITSSYSNWFSTGFIVLALLMVGYHYHYLKKREMEDYAMIYVMLLIGVVTHLIMDILFIESGIWL
jgi:hypothetical protein